MKSLIPWKKRARETVNLRKDFDDLFDRFFSCNFSFYSPLNFGIYDTANIIGTRIST
jgi:hypothetical protein